MSLKEQIYSILVVSCSNNFNNSISEIASSANFKPIFFASSVSEAKQKFVDQDFDFVIINSPLHDGNGTRFAIDCSQIKSKIVLFLIKCEDYIDMNMKLKSHGVYTLSKPTSKAMLLQAIDWMLCTKERFKKMEKKNISIEEKMEEIRIVNRAKFLLISALQMSESEAHRYIEKGSMDNCINKKEFSLSIIKLYT